MKYWTLRKGVSDAFTSFRGKAACQRAIAKTLGRELLAHPLHYKLEPSRWGGYVSQKVARESSVAVASGGILESPKRQLRTAADARFTLFSM